MQAKPMKVWVGYVDGKPHVYLDGVLTVAVYPSKRAASKCYEDVRPMELRPLRKDAAAKAPETTVRPSGGRLAARIARRRAERGEGRR